MDLLQMNFKSQPLIQLRQEVESMLAVPCALFFQGPEGCGKSAWAEAVLKHRGSFATVDGSNAPKSAREWKIFLQSQTVSGFLFDNIHLWSEPQRAGLIASLGQLDAVRGKIITTSKFDLEPQLNFRLGTRKLHVPSVKDCTEDIPDAIQFWLKVHCLVMGTSVPLVSSAALQMMKDASWVGGWSELVMILERAISFKSLVLLPEHIQFDNAKKSQSYLEAGLTLAEMERKLILQTLKLTASNKSQAARLLGISIRTLRNKLNEYNERRLHELV